MLVVNSSSMVVELDPDVEVEVDAPGVEVDEELPGVEVDGDVAEGIVLGVVEDDDDDDESEDDDDEDDDGADDDGDEPDRASGASTVGSCRASPAAHAAPTTTSAAVTAVKIPSILLISSPSRVWGTSIRHPALRRPQEKVKKMSRAASEA